MYPDSLLQWLGYVALVLLVLGALLAFVWIATNRNDRR